MASISTNQLELQQQQQQQKLDLAITLLLNTWPALTLAVQSCWGGPNSADKRDWLCGAISEIFATRPETDSYDVEDILVQVMNDEFDVAVDDGSAAEVADRIMAAKLKIDAGDYQEVDGMWADYREKLERRGAEQQQQQQQQSLFRQVDTREEDQETDGEEDDSEEEEDDNEDDEMGEAPPLVARQPRERVEPEVDEDGFTKVVGKKKR